MTTAKANKMKTEAAADKAKFYMNEIAYLTTSIETEKMQGRKFTAALADLTEVLEMNDYRDSFINLCWSKVTTGLTKFK